MKWEYRPYKFKVVYFTELCAYMVTVHTLIVSSESTEVSKNATSTLWVYALSCASMGKVLVVKALPSAAPAGQRNNVHPESVAKQIIGIYY